MHQARATTRPSSVRHQNNRPGRAGNEAPAYSYVNGFGNQDRRVEEYVQARNHSVLPLPPPTQPYVDAVGPADDEERIGGASNGTFIHKLYNALENKAISAFIRWNDAGDSVFIPNIERFKANVLEAYFNRSYDSFVRNMNGYAFKKIGRSTATATYKHKGNKFRRGCRDLLHEIKRVDSQQRKTSQQDQPIGEALDDSNSFRTSRSSGLSDTQSRIHNLEEENTALILELDEVKEELEEVKGELGEAQAELGGVKAELAALTKQHSNTEAALRALEKRFQDFSLHHTAPSAVNDFTHRSPGSTLRNAAGVTHGGYIQDSTHAGSVNMTQLPMANWHSTAVAPQRTPSFSQTPGTALSSNPHYAAPTAVLPPQHPVLNVEPSPPSSAARLAIDRDYPLPMGGPGQCWQGSFPGAPQPMLVDTEPPSGTFIPNGATPSWGRSARGSPRHLNLPTVAVQPKEPRSGSRDSGPSSTFGVPSQIWPPWG